MDDDDHGASLNVENLVERLDHLIAETEAYFDGSPPDTQTAGERTSEVDR